VNDNSYIRVSETYIRRDRSLTKSYTRCRKTLANWRKLLLLLSSVQSIKQRSHSIHC